MDSLGASHPKSWPTGFMLIQGNRLEALCGLMVSWMRRHPLRPLENEVILVQSSGIAQWLKLALAANPDASLGGGCGIAAALEVTLPARFIWRAYRSLLGELPDISAFDKPPMTWRLYRLLGDLDALGQAMKDPACLDPLRGFLAEQDDSRRRHQLAERLADLYDQYQVYRADWLDCWRRGEEVLIRPNGSREPLPEIQRWQPALWRCLMQDVANEPNDDVNPLGQTSRADIHHQFLVRARQPEAGQVAALAAGSLPRRVIVFGISSLPQQALEVLQAVSDYSQVLLFVHNPSQHYWGDIVEGRDLFQSAYRRNSARKVPEGLDDTELHLHGHPLLAAWGKQGRDYIRLLDAHDQRIRYESHFQAANLAIDLFESPGDDSLLRQLQDDIFELRPLAERQALGATLDASRDRSIEFLIAHSPQREIEILHDQLLDAFEQARRDGAPLNPRDVLVMVPDINVYAAHIEAVFGRLMSNDNRYIPFHISDQGQRYRHPILLALEALLNLTQSRFGVSDLLDLLDIAALRARFAIDEADLPRLRLWISGANIRWGLDAPQRASLGLPDDLQQNTWRFGLKRMLLGFAAGGGAAWREIEPYDEIGGLEAALIGPLVQLLEMLERYWSAFQAERAPDAWAALLSQLLDDAFKSLNEGDNQVITQVQQAIEQWTKDCRWGGAENQPMSLDVVRQSLLCSLDRATLAQHFLAGAVNFATLMPMRAIPFRQIWLLGMNDGDYPRGIRPADFDLMADDYRPGDRSRREDDRYLFLEALLSARERFVISWVGRSIRDNSARPPSVLVGQLRDHLAAGWMLEHTPSGVGAAEALLAALTTQHPLQPFSRRYFLPDRPARLFTYASEWRLLHQTKAVEPEAELEAVQFDGAIALLPLERFLRRPVSTFYTQRLALYLMQDAESIDNEEAFDFDKLGDWGLRDALLQAVGDVLVRQPDADAVSCLRAAAERLRRTGRLPLPPFGNVWVEALIRGLEAPIKRYQMLLQEYPQTCSVQPLRLLEGDLILEDMVHDVRQKSESESESDKPCRIRLVLQASRLSKGKGLQWHHLTRYWPRHLVAQLEAETTTHLIGATDDVILSPLPTARARELLQRLLRAYRQGMTALQPLACKTSFAFLADQNPASVYEGGYMQTAERDEHPGYQRFWPSFEDLRKDDRFEEAINAIYEPIFSHCQDRLKDE